ncbi:hypothetical protein Pst134EA_019424 [Puccinia striiformis f. sp. tritici]|uniref:hypothetical protein n=1 Tax=Puccinia striiformis f. sp. tritici TaxID=168172 RepID=UPI002008E4E5|nr:hypothetical protein Pst134EA_019424 [Puccinia striiformis f. sp. tritici]KAH9459269.1 hypothetical protein Pst134EA_019424 [Puccinia striiformis f. sp. tritici]
MTTEVNELKRRAKLREKEAKKAAEKKLTQAQQAQRRSSHRTNTTSQDVKLSKPYEKQTHPSQLNQAQTLLYLRLTPTNFMCQLRSLISLKLSPIKFLILEIVWIVKIRLAWLVGFII